MATVLAERLIDNLSVSEVAGQIMEYRRVLYVRNIAATTHPAAMTEVLTSAGMPDVGHTVTINGDDVVLEEREVTIDRDKSATVICTYRRQETTQPTYRGGTSLEQVVSELDRDGNQITVADSNGIIQGGEISTTSPQSTLVAEVVEATNTPGTLSSQWAGYVNEVAWNGGQPGQWLCESAEFDPVDMLATPRRWRFTYVFRRKRVSETDTEPSHQPSVYFVDPETNRPPDGLQPDVGYKRVEWYPARVFGTKFPG